MRVAIIDVGSNTVRLLVADRSAAGLEAVRQERAFIGLGEEIELAGRLDAGALWRAATVTHEFARIARELDASALEVVVTAPGRQSENGAELVGVLARAAAATVKVLTPDEEGELAYHGAVSRHDGTPRSIAVCDLGGGSTEIAVGTRENGIAWLRSFDVGAARLTRRHLHDRTPDRKALDAIRADVHSSLAAATPPLAKLALVAGGTARALGKLVGPKLGALELEEAVRILRRRPAAEVAKRYRIDVARVRTLPAGAVILAEVHALLETPLQVARGGLREGAALALAGRAESEAAA